MGRPQLSEADGANEVIRIRVRAQEKKKALREAKAEGMTLSKFIRWKMGLEKKRD